ncbi:hypothetical protein BH23GEM9_BH23GEM9_22710 [soil metagenome]
MNDEKAEVVQAPAWGWKAVRPRLGSAARELVYRWQYLRERLNSPVIPGASHVLKREIIRTYRERHGLTTFIETGTCLGDMVAAMLPDFERLHTIELSPYLHRRASSRFRRHPNVTVHLGDSAAVLKGVLEDCTDRVLFWLDAHYSGGVTVGSDIPVPIFEELRLALTHPVRDHVILIDDARCFDGTDGYPTLESLREFAALLRPDYQLHVESDVMRLVPSLAPDQ